MSDPNCLHCTINALADRWIEEGRVNPTDAVLRIAEVLGDYIGLFAPTERRQAIAEAIRVIDESCITSAHVHGRARAH